MVVNLAIFFPNIKYITMNNLSHADLKRAAKELKIPKYTTAKTKEDLIKLMRPHSKMQGKKIVSKAEGGRCWSGYEPVKGKKPFEKGSCKKTSTGGAIYNPTGDPEVSKKNEQIRKNMQKARDAKDKNAGPVLGGAVRDLALKHRNLLVERLKKVRSIMGGQLPSSVTGKLRDLDLKLGIKGGNVGMFMDDPALQKRIEDRQIEKGLDSNVENPCVGISTQCKPLARTIQASKKNEVTVNGKKLNKKSIDSCDKFYKEKAGCPEEQPKKKKRSKGVMGALSKTADVLMKGTDKAVAGIVTVGKPLFYASCGAAGSAAGGPLGAAAGATACKKLYEEMVEKPGYEDSLMNRANLSPTEKRLLDMMQKASLSKGKKALEAPKEDIIEEEIEGEGMDKIDWDGMDWGSFSEQLEYYNKHHKKNLKLPQFAALILKNPGKYKQKTVKRARFYQNVLSKK